ncbi:signal transduction histidine kinase [Streptacidiphilus sp. MAP12-16]|uniref:sensor histidine kinase n=1 Tax=Streptacidiphilus sp. MAP12-16 TaxID=3156300 RepID=UPI00351978D3
MSPRRAPRFLGGLSPRRATLRTRVTVVASLGITAAVVLGVLFMYLLQMNSVHRTIDGQLHTYATQIAQSAPTGRWPQPLPASSLDASAEAQVLAPDGTVLAATRTLVGLPAVYALPAGSDTPVRQKAADGVIPTEIRVVAVQTTVDGRPVTIVTGTATDLLRQVNSEFLRHLLFGFPVILILAAGTVWLVVGRALRPVEKIRLAVTDITSADLSQRVPEPGTPDEIGHLAHTMNDMLTRLEDSARRQRRFVADASHELRSPLAAIRTTLEVGLAHPDRAPWPAIAERAAGQSVRLEDLLQQLLLLARADEHQLSAQQQRVDVGTLLRDVVAGTPAQDRAIELDVVPAATVVGNPDDLQRLFRNIIDNAVRHARNRILITATTTADAVRVHVDDDGPGIPSADRERVFHRFVRLDGSRERSSGGTGLGLAIAREIALAHHGHIAITDSPGDGAHMVITLPVAPDGAPPTPRPSAGTGTGP